MFFNAVELDNSDAHEKAQNDSTFKKPKCEKCGSYNVTPIITSSTKTTTTNGGYSAGSGCCGFALLGPLGLLFGLCGSNSETKTEQKEKMYWVCKDCGNKQRDTDELRKEEHEEMDDLSYRLAAIIPIIVAIVRIGNFDYSELSYNDILWSFVDCGIIYFICLFAITILIEYLMKEDQNKVEENPKDVLNDHKNDTDYEDKE